MSSNEWDSKKKQPDKKKQKKKQQPEAALPQPANEASSSKIMHQPCQDEASAGTSATGLLTSMELSPDHRLCLDTLRESFDQSEQVNKLLKDAKLTNNQKEALEQSFLQLSQMISRMNANSNRFRKTHGCLICDFAISHQCMSLDFIRRIPFGSELMDSTNFIPDRTVICDCGFAFFHAHHKRSLAYMMVASTDSKETVHWKSRNRSFNFSCPKCYIMFDMTSRIGGVCYDVAQWDRVTDDNRRLFYNSVASCLHYPTDTLLMDEFYACSKGCCLVFHRCCQYVC